MLLAARAVTRSGPDGRPRRGQPRKLPVRLVGDKGYSYPSARRLLRRRGIASVIPTRSDQPRQPRSDRAAYRGRNRVERSIGRLTGPAVATRYDECACNCLAWVNLAATVIWL